MLLDGCIFHLQARIIWLTLLVFLLDHTQINDTVCESIFLEWRFFYQLDYKITYILSF